MRKIPPARFLRVAILFFVLLGQLHLSGCKNPFKTRYSPPPIVSEGTWETPARPDIVIQNLFYAYNEKIMGNFIQCLCDSFGFSAPEDSMYAVNQGRADLFAHWDRSVEISVTTGIFNTFRQNPDSFSLSFRSTLPVPDQVGETLAVLSRDYELYIFDLETTPPDTSLAKGTATFYMKQTSLNWWSIYFWSDIPAAAGKPDWADFKARFR
jgi:hypothetical protein